MKEIFKLCDYSHDYDGFAFVEDDCKCTICKEGEDYFLCGNAKKRINLDNDSISTDDEKIKLTAEELSLSRRELCKKYCSSHWAKDYDIHNSWEIFKDETPVKELLKNAQK